MKTHIAVRFDPVCLVDYTPLQDSSTCCILCNSKTYCGCIHATAYLPVNGLVYKKSLLSCNVSCTPILSLPILDGFPPHGCSWHPHHPYRTFPAHLKNLCIAPLYASQVIAYLSSFVFLFLTNKFKSSIWLI